MKWKFFVLPCLMLACSAMAVDPGYTNKYVQTYTIPGNPPPTINATNFVNNNVFSVYYDTYTYNTEYYEPWYVQNYINNANAVMSVDTENPYTLPVFQFDTQTTGQIPHLMANSFYNGGTIQCGVQFPSGGAELIVSATNISNPGEIQMGPNALMMFSGGNVDFTGGTLAMQGFDASTSPVALGIDWGAGMNTNGGGWSPLTNLTQNAATSSHFAIDGTIFDVFDMHLDNSKPYYNLQYVGTNYVLLRAVFVQDSSPNVSYNVYFSSNTPVAFGGVGDHSIQDNIVWYGTRVDPATGNTLTNYLMLDDTTAVSTNTPLASDGIPLNFTFSSSPTLFPLLGPSSSSQFYPSGLFDKSLVTNFYSYTFAQLVSTTVSTNASSLNPSGALTNLPGRVQINSNGRLDLSQVSISGMNYLSLTATNQFAGNAGASIASPYSDISLGATNGLLTITNLLAAGLPNWSGTVEAWSGRWLVVTNGITNDFRILLINSQVSPVTLAQVQNLNLYSQSNSVVISDVFNILNTLYIDATNLTLTANGTGGGAMSVDGELNFETDSILWPSSMPNVRNLTNDGTITILNGANFTGATNSLVVTPTTQAVPATATLFESGPGNNVSGTNWVAIGNYTYTFVTNLVNTVSNQVKIAATFNGSMSNLIAAINHTGGSGASYSTSTTTNTLVMAGLLQTNHSFVVTARTGGLAGDSISVASSTTNLIWSGGALSGGANYTPGSTNVVSYTVAYDNFINDGTVSDLGATVDANYFENNGSFYNGDIGSFQLQSLNTVLSGSLTAGGSISITTGSLVASNLALQAGWSLTLLVTNQLTDTGVSNGAAWYVNGANYSGLNLPFLPTNSGNCGLLGTTIYCFTPAQTNKQVVNTWAGQDQGPSVNGYVNNAAVGRLVLDGAGQGNVFTFQGVGPSNALYVDCLVLSDQATNRDGDNNFTALNIVSNASGSMVIYYAQALMGGTNGFSIAEKMNLKNNGRLRWVTNYAGYFSSVYITFTNSFGQIQTNAFNAALRESPDIDSDGDGIYNLYDSTPFGTNAPFGSLSPGKLKFAITTTNLPLSPPPKGQLVANASGAAPVPMAVLQWQTVTNATNYVFYKTNLAMANWLPLTNFNTPASAASSPVTVTVSDPATNSMRAYRVRVDVKQ